MGLIERLLPGPVALDTSIFIYWLEEDPRFLPVVEPLFEAIDEERLRALTSGLTLLETLVMPYATTTRSWPVATSASSPEAAASP